jgi:hypothetical protein
MLVFIISVFLAFAASAADAQRPEPPGSAWASVDCTPGSRSLYR